MTPMKYYEGIDSVAVIGNYLPRQCGIATFTTDLVEGLSAEAPDIYNWAAAMNDKPEGYPYPEKVRFEINQNKLSDYSIASQFLNISQTDIVCVQHEYGLFGGPAGSHLLKLLGDLRMPVVTTLHTVFKKALRAVEHFHSPRAIAFCLVGMHAYLDKFSGDSDVRRIRVVLAERLFDQFKNNATDSWPWLENTLNYANGKLPHALLLSGQWIQRHDMIDMGLNSLKWLLAIQTEDSHFAPIGSNGWYEQGGPRARFDQQPIESNAMIEACVEAFNITRDKTWIDHAVMCFNWYLGHNDLNMPLYDPKTGGCRDGLMADGINQNQGAESSLAWLLSLMTLQKLYADEVLKQSSSPKAA